jgi:predicted Na+-dependent transporter/alpha-L-fucosidase
MHLHKKNISRLALLTAMVLFIAAIGRYVAGSDHSTGVFVLPALILMATGFLGIGQLKAYSYTIWILVAVAAGMYYPSSFVSIGSFQLKDVIIPSVQVTMFGMGANMSFDDFRDVVKMPKGVLLGVTCHYTVMPVVAFLLSRMFDFPPEIAGGVILIGCVPSAMASNVMSYLAKANLALAVTIGACSTILSPFATPFLMKLLGGQYVEINVARMMLDITNMIIIPIVAGFIFNLFYFGNASRKTKWMQLSSFAVLILLIHFMMMLVFNTSAAELGRSLIRSMFFFYILPMVLAILLKRSRRITRPAIEKGLSLAAMLGIIINTAIITSSGRDNLLQVGGLLIITCLLQNLIGFNLGYFTGKLFGLPEKDRRTLAFEVGMQNGGIATGLALKMGKVASVGLASAIFGPLQNLTGSALANWFRRHSENIITLKNKNVLMKKLLILFAFIALISGCKPAEQKSDITQDQRMQWWRDARFGMFIHWGLYSIPAGEWKGKEYPQIGEWIMKNARIPVAEYTQLAARFNPVKFDAAAFVATAKEAGMKYIVITSKHHDGFAMFKSRASTFNIVDATPYGKDVIRALSEACQKEGIKLCFYYSQSRDWHEPNGLDNDWDFPKERNFQQYLDEKVKPQLTELLTNYGPIGLIWFDTPMSISKDQAQSLKDLVRKLQPACIISGRLGGGVETDYGSTGDNVIPSTVVSGDWEVPATFNNTWGYKKNDNNWKSYKDITRLLFDIASKGGNYLLNVGPTSEGVIPPQSVDILQKAGDWMKVNNEAIRGTQASPFTVEFDWGNITRKQDKLYLGIYQWPTGALNLEGLKNKVKKAYLLSDTSKKDIPFEETYDKAMDHHRLNIHLPAAAPDTVVSIVVLDLEGTPAVETTIAQQRTGIITLPGASAAATKNGQPAALNFNSSGGGGANWTDTAMTLSWEFKVEKAGTYRVDIVSAETGAHGTPTWLGGQLVEVVSNNQHFQTRIVPDSKEFNPRSVYWNKIHTQGGSLVFKAPGVYKLSMSLVEFPAGKGAFTFRAINLVAGK